MSAKHTPAPWQAIGTDPAGGGDWFWINAQPNPAMRGFTKNIGVINGSQTDPEQQANAFLAAAAPELLEALETVMQWVKAWDVDFLFDDEWPADEAKINAAIAKARGGEA